MPGGDGVPAVGRYELGTAIGQGGLATVYEARDTLLDREVAVKVFAASADTRTAIRIQEDEARRVASLDHSCLARLYDVGVSEGTGRSPQVYLVMELVRGGDLRSLLDDRVLTAREVAGIGHDIASALNFVHRNGLLHRDLKPANILVEDSKRRGRLHVKLTDLGISSAIGADPGQGTTHGTAAYLAPEQVEGEDPSEASDTFGLGLVLIESLTGRIEFPGDREETVLERMRRDPRVPTGIPGALSSVIRGLTRRDPATRMGLPDAIDAFERILVDFAEDERETSTGAAEAERLEAVRRYRVSDSVPDEALDRIRAITQRLFDVPIAVIEIVEADRVWVKSGSGMPYPHIDRAVSPCAITVARREAFTVDDTELDDWSRNNELLAELGVRSFATAPLITTDGFAIGSVCVFDTRPRAFSKRELADLDDLAKLAMRELEVRLAARRAVFGA
ncbi:MAG: GAF domain-containing serine/threonine-protein kinase [Naasia sp.]